MKIDASGYFSTVDEAGSVPGTAERTGYDGWTPEEAMADLGRRYGDVITRIALVLPENRDRARWDGLIDGLRGAGPR